MLIKCPNCCREYEFEVGKSVVEFSFKCPNCKTELVVTDNNEVVLSSQAPKSESQSYTVQVQSTKTKESSGCLKKFFLFLIVILVLLAFTCPDSRVHKDKIQSVVTSAIDNMLRERNTDKDNQFLVTIGSLISTKMVELAITDKVTVENYFFFSLGYYYMEGERKVVSIGLFNHVFTLSEEQVMKNLENILNK